MDRWLNLIRTNADVDDEKTLRMKKEMKTKYRKIMVVMIIF